MEIENDLLSEEGSGSSESWSEWTKWSECAKSCGDSSWKFRTRKCINSKPVVCLGDSVETKLCYVPPC